MTERSPRPPGGTGDIAVVAGLGALAMTFVAVGLGARLACVVAGHGRVDGGLTVWASVTSRLVRTGDMAAAWSGHAIGLPSPALVWAAIGLVVAGFAAVSLSAWCAWRRWAGAATIGPFGVVADAGLGSRRDLAPLVVSSPIPPKGRMLLGRLTDQSGRLGAYLATEERRWAAGSTRRRLAGRSRVQDRGSVAIIGPTGSQKTQALIAAIAGFDGVVIGVSVKRDLFEATAAARAEQGEVAVFDPSGATKLATARWSPLERATTVSGAYKAGAALAESVPRSGVTNADYWSKHGEDLLGSFIVLAGLSRLLGPGDGWDGGRIGLEQIATWVAISAGSHDPTINRLLRCAARPGRDLEVQLMARAALTAFVGLQRQDPKILSSVYTTARLAVNPWMEPAIAHAATLDRRKAYNQTALWPAVPRYVDLDWLMADRPDGTAGVNTLYLSADSGDFERLAPVLGGLLADIKDQVHAADIEGKALTKPLMIVIDETGQLGFTWLPREVSTIAGLGAFFVTSWQSKSQIDAAYGALADTVIAGHPTVMVFSGVKDPSTARFVLPQLGHAHVKRFSETRDGPAGWGWSKQQRPAGRSVSQSQQREALADEHVLREMPPGQAILIHRTLPAALVTTVRWWDNDRIGALVPRDATGRPAAPKDLVTCPLDRTVPVTAPRSGETIDRRSLDDALRLLPVPTGNPDLVSTQAGATVNRQSEPSTPAESPERPSASTAASTSREAATAGAVRPGQLALFAASTGQDADSAPAAGGSRDAATVGPATNRRAGLCALCGALVAPFTGHQTGVRHGLPVVTHHPACPTGSAS